MDTGNKNSGEWAELYTLLEVLGEGKLFAADGDLNKIEEQYFPVISVQCEQDSGDNLPITYTVDLNSDCVLVDLEGQVQKIPMIEFKKEAKTFFEIISTRQGRAFSVPEITPFLTKLKNPATKKSSSKKADIHIVIHDTMTGFEQEVGFSIKSKHSKPASLLNPSGQTLFQYEIKNNTATGDDVLKELLDPDHYWEKNKRKSVYGPKERFKKLHEGGFNLVFSKVKGMKFRENLQIIDSSLDVILAECLSVFMLDNKAKLKDIVEEVARRNPCCFSSLDSDRVTDFYVYKIKKFITDIALGMMPSKPWRGVYDASGGYIIVKDEGEIVCYHLYSWNALQDYLFNNLRLESPSSTGVGSKASFNYALLYEEDGKSFVDMCLQIRFL